jgi:thiol-disulfide isomerase/thioredoxin
VTSDRSGARLVLYSRAWCHLCDDMRAAVEALRQDFAFNVDVIDVDCDPGLTAKYDELVPVLEADGRELCHYHLDEAKVREYLSRFS